MPTSQPPSTVALTSSMHTYSATVPVMSSLSHSFICQEKTLLPSHSVLLSSSSSSILLSASIHSETLPSSIVLTPSIHTYSSTVPFMLLSAHLSTYKEKTLFALFSYSFIIFFIFIHSFTCVHSFRKYLSSSSKSHEPITPQTHKAKHLRKKNLTEVRGKKIKKIIASFSLSAFLTDILSDFLTTSLSPSLSLHLSLSFCLSHYLFHCLSYCFFSLYLSNCSSLGLSLCLSHCHSLCVYILLDIRY